MVAYTRQKWQMGLVGVGRNHRNVFRLDWVGSRGHPRRQADTQGEGGEMSDTVHVYPDNDIREHIIDGDAGDLGQCPCHPEIEYGPGKIVIHNSFDGRELIERKYTTVLQ